MDTNFNANSDSKVTLVIPLASAVEGNKEDGLMSSEDKGVLDGLPDKIGGLDDRIITIEHDYVTSQGLQAALSPIVSDVASLGGQVGSLDQGKADKVSPATSGNLASLDAGGDLADSGISGTAVGGALDKLGGIESGAQANKIESISVDGTEITPANKTVNIDLSGKVDVVAGKQLSTEDYTTAEKDKLGHVAAGAQVNVIETVQLNGTAITPTEKTVNIQLDKSSVGLGNVNNTSDSDKPISTATQSALDGKANKLVPASANNLAALDTNGQLTEVGLTLVNNSITAIGGKTITGTESVFVAIYNSTRGDAITAALNSGKVVISVYYDGSIGFVTYQDKNNHKYGFTCVRKISNQLGQTPGTIQFGGWFCSGAGNSWFGQHSSLVLPAPGSNDIGKVLTAYKDNTNNGNYRLETINGLPSSTSSDEGKLLTVNSEGTPSWEEPTKELPPIVAGDEDKFLRVSTSGVPAWDNPFEKSSWGTVITDGDNGLADENGNLIFDENETELWTSFNNVGFGAERAIADVEGNDIIATYAKKSEVPAGLPSTTGASNGDVLTVNNGAATWAAPGGGGGDDGETISIDISEFMSWFIGGASGTAPDVSGIWNTAFDAMCDGKKVEVFGVTRYGTYRGSCECAVEITSQFGTLKDVIDMVISYGEASTVEEAKALIMQAFEAGELPSSFVLLPETTVQGYYVDVWKFDLIAPFVEDDTQPTHIHPTYEMTYMKQFPVIGLRMDTIEGTFDNPLKNIELYSAQISSNHGVITGWKYENPYGEESDYKEYLRTYCTYSDIYMTLRSVVFDLQ